MKISKMTLIFVLGLCTIIPAGAVLAVGEESGVGQRPSAPSLNSGSSDKGVGTGSSDKGIGTFGAGDPEFMFGISPDNVYLVYVNPTTGKARTAPLFHKPFSTWGGATNSDNSAMFWATDRGIYSTGEESALYAIYPDLSAPIKVGSGYGDDPAVGPGTFAQSWELGLDDNSNTLYATNYTRLYTVDKTAGTLTYIGPFGNGFDSEPIERVWSMDYDPVLDKLVIVDQKWSEAQSRVAPHMYYADTTTGAATYVGPTGENGLTDLCYSSLGLATFSCGNLPNRMMHSDTTTGTTTELARVAANMMGLSQGFAEVEAPLVAILSPYTVIQVCTDAMIDTSHEYHCEFASSSLSSVSQTSSDFAQEPGQSGGIGQTATSFAQRTWSNSSGKGMINHQVNFDTNYNGPNAEGQGIGTAHVTTNGTIRIGYDGTYPRHSRGLLLLIDGSRALVESDDQYTCNWHFKAYRANNQDRPIIHLTNESPPEVRDTDFMGAAYVCAGEDIYFECEIVLSANGLPAPANSLYNLFSFSALAKSWLSQFCSGCNNWCNYGDINQDGLANWQDMQSLTSQWLSPWTSNNDSSLQLDLNFVCRTVEAPLYSGLLNDACEDAIPIAADQRYVCTSEGATGTDISLCGSNDSKDVWYEFTPYENGYYQILVENKSLGSPYVSMYDGCGGTELYCGSRWDSGLFQGNAWNPYLIRVAGSNNTEGTFTLTVNHHKVPENDDCADAIVVDDSQFYNYHNYAATGTSSSFCGTSDTKDVWYKYLAHADGTILFDVYPDQWGQDMTLSLYESCGGGEMACANTVHCSEDDYTRLAYDVTNGQWYYLRVAFDNDYMGEFGMYINYYPPAANDECGSATTIYDEDILWDETTYGATGSSPSSCGIDDTKDVWYRYTASQDGLALIKARNYNCVSELTLSIYAGCPGTEQDCAVSEESYMGDREAKLQHDVIDGNTYYIRVAFNDNTLGSFEISLDQYAQPTNDDCTNAEGIMVGDYVSGWTYGATGTDITTMCGDDDSKDLWYTFTADADATVVIHAGPQEGEMGTEDPFSVAIFDDTCGGNELDCESGNYYPETELNYDVTDGTTYYIRIAQEGDGVGEFFMDIYYGGLE